MLFRSHTPPDTGSIPFDARSRTVPAKPFLPRCEASVFGLAALDRLAFYRGPAPSNAVVLPDQSQFQQPQSYREWPGYQESFVPFNIQRRPFIPMAEARGFPAENW